MGADRGERTPAEPVRQGGRGGGAAGGDGGLQGRLGDGAARRLRVAYAQADEGQHQGLQGVPAQLINQMLSVDGSGLVQKSVYGVAAE